MLKNDYLGRFEEFEGRRVFLAGWREIPSAKIDRPHFRDRIARTIRGWKNIWGILIFLGIALAAALLPLGGAGFALFFIVPLALLLVLPILQLQAKWSVKEAVPALDEREGKEFPVHVTFSLHGKQYAEDSGVVVLQKLGMFYDGWHTAFSVELSAANVSYHARRNRLTVSVPKTGFEMTFTPIVGDEIIGLSMAQWAYQLPSHLNRNYAIFIPPCVVTRTPISREFWVFLIVILECALTAAVGLMMLPMTLMTIEGVLCFGFVIFLLALSPTRNLIKQARAVHELKRRPSDWQQHIILQEPSFGVSVERY